MSLSKSTKQFTDDDLITCGICHVEIEHPRSLVCLHTYCLGCLREWSKKKKDVVICPMCRESTPLPPDGVDGLRSNFFVTKLKDRKAVSRQLLDKDTKIVCTSCDVTDNNEAVARCLECDDFLCSSCEKAHKNFRWTKQHSVHTLTEFRSGKVDFTKKSKEEHCKEHTGQVLWFYCTTCGVPICRDCTVVEHPSGSHKLVKLEAAVAGQREDIQRLVANCEMVKQRVDRSMSSMNGFETVLESKCKTATAAIDETKQQLMSSFEKKLDLKCNEQKKEIANLKAKSKKEMAAQADSILLLQSRLDTALTMANQVTNHGSDCDVASVYTTLTTTLKQLEQVKMPTISRGMKTLRFEQNGSLKVPAFQSIGKITTSLPWDTPWTLVKTFGDTGKGKLRDARGIAVNQDSGEVAVADYAGSKVFVYDIDDGKMKMAIDTTKSLHSNPSKSKSLPHGIVVHQGSYIVTDRTFSPTVYDSGGSYIRQIPVTNDKTDCTYALAVNSQGHVLVGHSTAKSLECHNFSDGKYLSTLKIPVRAHYVAVSSNDRIIIGSHVLDLQGQIIHALRPPAHVTRSWRPTGVCTFEDGEEEQVVICNCDGKHGIYRFSLTTGDYLGCVTTEVREPRGIEFVEDDCAVMLMVTEGACVKVFAPAEP